MRTWDEKKTKDFKYRKFLEQLRTQLAEMLQYCWEIQDEEIYVFQLNTLKDVTGSQRTTWVTVRKLKITTKYSPPLSLACVSAADIEREERRQDRKWKNERRIILSKTEEICAVISSCMGFTRPRQKGPKSVLLRPYNYCQRMRGQEVLHCVASVYSNTQLFSLLLFSIICHYCFIRNRILPLLL